MVLALLLSTASAMGAGGPRDETPIRVSEAREGDAIRFSIASATRAQALTKGPDGNVWFSAKRLFENGRGVIGRIGPTGGVVEFLLPPTPEEQSGLPAIVTGPDGNLWFTESGAGKIGRMTPGGELTEFPLPAAGSRPTAIAAGPDGNLWFTEEAGDRIGRITPAGAVTEFPLSPGSGPAGIAAGPDGNLWFTEKTAGRIGRITPAGSVTEYPLPDPASRPAAITVGPDGNLWFVLEGAPRIGRIDPSGSIRQFALPTKAPAHRIAVAGGDLWFATSTAIGSISPRGQATRPACLEFCRLPFNAIAEGPEGNLWFGADTSITGGGGGTRLAAAGAPGIVGKFFPPPLTVAIGTRGHPVSGRRTTLRLRCEGETASAVCTGSLQIVRRIQAGGGPKTAVLGQRRYKLGSGKGHGFSLRLTKRAGKLLARRGSLPVRVRATVRGGKGTAERIVLRQAKRSKRR